MVMYLSNVWISTIPCPTVLYELLIIVVFISFFVYWDLLNPNKLLNWTNPMTMVVLATDHQVRSTLLSAGGHI